MLWLAVQVWSWSGSVWSSRAGPILVSAVPGAVFDLPQSTTKVLG